MGLWDFLPWSFGLCASCRLGPFILQEVEASWVPFFSLGGALMPVGCLACQYLFPWHDSSDRPNSDFGTSTRVPSLRLFEETLVDSDLLLSSVQCSSHQVDIPLLAIASGLGFQIRFCLYPSGSAGRLLCRCQGFWSCINNAHVSLGLHRSCYARALSWLSSKQRTQGSTSIRLGIFSSSGLTPFVGNSLLSQIVTEFDCDSSLEC